MATRSCERLRRVSAVRLRVIRRRVSFGAAFRYPLLRTSWPGRCEWSFPLLARRRSWGSTLRRFIPAHGWPTISGRLDPPAFSSRRPTRLIFVELARFAVLKLGVRESLAKSGRGRVDGGFWVSPVCDPCRGLRGTRVPDGIGRDRSCLGLRLFQGCGHTTFASRRRAVTTVSKPRDSSTSRCVMKRIPSAPGLGR
jgi:hypothetical protein